MSLYRVLGVRKNATKETIRKAFLAKAKECHPDKGGNREDFQQIQHAWEVLGDAERRQRYDDTGFHDRIKPEDEEERRQVGAIIAQIFNNVVAASTDLRYTNLIERLKDQLSVKRDQMEMDRLNLQQQISRNEELTKRVKYKGDSIDFIASSLAANLSMLKMNLEGVDKAIKLHQKVVETVESYEYEMDSSRSEGQFSPGGATARHTIFRLGP